LYELIILIVVALLWLEYVVPRLEHPFLLILFIFWF